MIMANSLIPCTWVRSVTVVVVLSDKGAQGEGQEREGERERGREGEREREGGERGRDGK